MSIVKGYVQTDLGQIHYRKKEGEGLPIVCFHQTASSSAMFEAFMAEFTGSNPIIALDTPGFGGSYDPIDEPTMDQYADQMVDAMRGLDIGKAHLFGHHTGASIAVEIAARYADLSESLTMIGPVVITREEAEMFKQVYPKDFSLKADGSHIMKMWAYVEEIGGNHSLALHHREFVDTARAWEGHIKMYSQIWDQDFIALYQAVQCPMLIMCSENDVLWSIFERAQELRPDASVKVIAGSNFQLDEAPGEVASAIHALISEG